MLKYVQETQSSLKNRTNCHDCFDRLFEHKVVEEDEDTSNSLRSLTSPYWSPNFCRTSTPENSGAGVVRTAYLAQVLGYYPFGSLRVDESYGGTDVSKKFTGFELDRETDLNYAGARYLDSARGQFMSQDPVFQAVGDWKTVQEKTGNQLDFYLQNPQTHNSYSYAANNPLRYIDKNGEYIADYSLEGNLFGGSLTLGVKFDDRNGKFHKVDIYGGVGKSVGASFSMSGMLSPGELPDEETYNTYEVSGTAGYIY